MAVKLPPPTVLQFLQKRNCPGPIMRLRRVWPAMLWLSMSFVAFAVSTPGNLRSNVLERRERQVSRMRRLAQFVDVRHISSRPSCEDVQPPQALTTPDPLITPATLGRKVKISFIIGTDGRVHSPLILESAGLAGD